MDVNRIREDFPSLQQKLDGKPIVYMDSACMSLRPRQVIAAMNEYYEKYPGCAGRSSHKFAEKVTEEYSKARTNIAKFIGAKADEIVFTRNTTEGLNLVFNTLLKKDDVVLTTDREHNSNLVPLQILSKKIGIIYKILLSKNDMTFDIDNFQNIMNKDVKLVSVVHSSNLDGYTLPVKDIIKISHDFGALVMLDGAQSVPHKDIDVKKMDVDFLAFSGHKMCGPSGTGVLYGKYHLLEELQPFMVGGDTVAISSYDSHVLLKPPEKFEAGLQNYAGAIGLAKAAEYIDKIGRSNIEGHEIALNEFITEEIKNMPGMNIIGPGVQERGGIISFNINGIGHHDIAIMLDKMANIMVRSGQHCVHSWFNAHKIDGSVRASLYLYNTMEDAKVFIDNLNNIIKLR